jgi:hypothetical protein
VDTIERQPMDELVAQVLAREQFTVVEYARISEFAAARTARHAYRVSLADGRTIKARRTLSDARARSVCDALQALGNEHFARVIGREGAVLIEEWVNGDALSSGTAGEPHLHEAAALLARVHRTAVVGGVAVAGLRSTAPRLAEAETRLSSLIERGALAVEDRETLSTALRQFDPRQAQAGLVHLDFALENMVIDMQGQLRLVDNEAMGVDAFDYDLARSWYRNGLPPETWARFEDAYREAAGPGARDRSAPFWRIAAVVEGAVTRLDADPARAVVPLDRLRDMAAALRRPARSTADA